MAEEVFKKLEEQLNCPICLDIYTSPKLLQCFHVYCQGCLVKLVKQDQQGELTVTCPNCRQVTSVPGSGVSSLQTAFHINQLLEIQDSVEKIKEPGFSQPPDEDRVKILPDKLHTTILELRTCTIHAQKELELYCETCGELICSLCAIKGGVHYTHEYDLIGSAFEKHREQISPSLEPMESRLMIINQLLENLDQRCVEISDQRESILVDIDKTIARFHEDLDKRRKELVDQLDQLTHEKLKRLATQKDQIETIQAQLSSLLHFARENLQKENQEEVLRRKPMTVRQIKEQTAVFQSDALKLNSEADVVFSVLNDLTTLCRNFGQVSTSSEVKSSWRNLETATESVQVSAFESGDFDEDLPIDSFSIHPYVAGNQGDCVKGGQSLSESTLPIPTATEDSQKWNVTVDHQSGGGKFPSNGTASSPKSPPLYSHVLTIGRLHDPKGVAFTESGKIVVSQSLKHCLSIFSPTGKELLSFGCHGSHPGEFRSPRGLAIDAQGNVLVADSDNHRIQKLTLEGRPLAVVGTEGSGRLQFRSPRGIAFCTVSNKVYVVDWNHRVQILNPDLTFSGMFGKMGSGKGELYCPWGVALDSSGNVCVADGGNHRIQIFTVLGEFVMAFGSSESGGPLRFNWPLGVGVDNTGRIYVCDSNNHRVSIFTSNGQFLTSFGGEGEGEGEMKLPRGLAVDQRSGVVCVCDSANNRVQLFK